MFQLTYGDNLGEYTYQECICRREMCQIVRLVEPYHEHREASKDREHDIGP